MSGHQEIKYKAKRATDWLITAICKFITQVSSMEIPNSNIFKSVIVTEIDKPLHFVKKVVITYSSFTIQPAFFQDSKFLPSL